MATGAITASESDVLEDVSSCLCYSNPFDPVTNRARIDSHAVVLVVDSGTGNINTATLRDIKAVGVCSAFVVASRIINGDVRECQVLSTVNAKHLDGGVQDVQAANNRGCQVVSIEEGRLGCSTIGTFAVPPTRAVTINRMSVGTGDSDTSSGHGDQRPIPLFIAEGGCALENNLQRELAGMNRELFLLLTLQ